MSQPTGASLTDVQAGRDITITVGAGEAVAAAVAPLVETIVTLSRRLGMIENAALELLRSLGHDTVPTERLVEALNTAAAQVRASERKPAHLGGEGE